MPNAAINEEQANIVSTPPRQRLTDILTDDNGAVALHRLEVILWTFVLWRDPFSRLWLTSCSMPDSTQP